VIALRKRLIIAAGSLVMLVLAAGVVLTTLALYRYGGVEGVVQRAQMEFAVEQLPDELYVPTPESVAEQTEQELTGLAEALPAPETAAEPEATVEPSPLAGQLASLAENAPVVEPFKQRHVPERQRAKTENLAGLDDLSGLAAPTPAPTAIPTPVFVPAMRLEGLAHYWQTWNNCGPATLSSNLSYFGIKIGQDKIGPVLKPEKDDKNVGPEQLAQFAREQGLRATVRVQGDTNRLKALLAAGIPVLVETWYEPKPNDGMGHYRLIVGYDDAAAHWIAYDSYESHGLDRKAPYAGIKLPYKSFDQLWKVFNRTYVPIYDEARATAVEAVLGKDMDDQSMYERSLAKNLAAVKANPKDNFAWFNVGSDYVALGNYEAAATAFDTARKLKLPWRMLWYQFGPFEAYYMMGRHKDVIALADATIKQAKNDEELYFWKGMAQQSLGDIAGARASLGEALRQRPTYQQAVDAMNALPAAR
jgi:tetratricopeptide (TPR) repeat protein